MTEVLKQPVIIAYITSIDCPACEVPQQGFINDPRGGDFKCESCGASFHVPTDATVDFG